jgi:hypothetical protein
MLFPDDFVYGKDKQMEIKPGKNSTEFVLTVLSAVLGILVLFGVVTQAQVDSLVQALQVFIEAAVGLWLVIGPIIEYIKQRTELKKEAAK